MAKHKPVRVLDPARTRLTIVGCGGTGGALLPQAARLLYGLKELRRGATPPLFGERPPDGVPQVLLVDGDEVERKNLLRQNFLANDLHRPKALVLAERYGAAFGLEVAAYPRYVNAATDFAALIPEGGVVVGCVDNAKTRQLLHDRLSTYSDVVYVDAGNAGVDLPDGDDAPTRDEKARLKESGWAGQVVCGVRKNGETVIALPGEQMPDLLEGNDLLPDEVPCGQVVVSLPQRHLTNQLAATTLMQFLTPLLTDGTLLHHRSFFDARRGYTRSDAAIDAIEEVAV